MIRIDLTRIVPSDRSRMIIMLIGLTVILILVWRGRLMFGVSSAAKGVENGSLAECPTSPNCVCSQSTDSAHHIEPLTSSASAEQTWSKLIELLRKQPRTKIVKQNDQYLHVEFTTLLMRFVDDVEFLRDEGAGVIHVRSASRVGYSDLGANRSRIETIRTHLDSSLQGN